MSFWNDERAAEAKRRWENGESATTIALAMGAPTRNTVLGKLTRMGLTSGARVVTVKRAPSAPRLTPPKPVLALPPPARVDSPPAEPREPGALRVPPSDLARPLVPLERLGAADCRWPIGDVFAPDFGFCGQPAPEGQPYCTKHSRRAYASGSPIVRRAS